MFLGCTLSQNAESLLLDLRFFRSIYVGSIVCHCSSADDILLFILSYLAMALVQEVKNSSMRAAFQKSAGHPMLPPDVLLGESLLQEQEPESRGLRKVISIIIDH